MSNLHKPYPDMQTALEQWRSFDDPARNDLRGKRARRRLAAVVLVALAIGVFSLGLTVVGLMRQNEDNMTSYSGSVMRINEMLADNQNDVLEDIESQLVDRRAQLAKLDKQLETAQTQMQELVQQRTQLDEQLIDAPVPETEEQQQAQRSAEERLLDLSNRIAADTNAILQLKEVRFTVKRNVAKLEGELEHVQNAVAQIERERAARQQQVEDEDSPVTALQADLEAAERRVAELVETNDVLRQSLKGLTIECEGR